jgi:hypothetical protein
MKRTAIFIFVLHISFILFSQVEEYRILFKQTFEKNTVGKYLRKEWAENWNLPVNYFSDPRPAYWDSYDQFKIVEEDNNKFFRREVKPGEIGTGEKEGCTWNVPVGPVDELYFSFKVRFPESMFTQGKHIEGKLHGLYKPSNSVAGQRPLPNTGFYTLMMFRNTPDFKRLSINLYIYYQDMQHNACAKSYPLAFCPEEDRIYYGNYRPVNFYFDPDRWYTITQRCVMNDPGEANGIIEIFIDGDLIASYNHYRFRDTDAVKIEYLSVSNFFGGGPPTAPAFHTHFDFDDFIAFTYTDEADVPKGTNLSSSGRKILVPSLF